MRPAAQQCANGGHPRTGEAQNRITLASKDGRYDHRSFSVASPIIARMIETIQKRITTVASCQPSCSK